MRIGESRERRPATGLHDSPASAPELAVTAQVRHEQAAARTHDEPALGWTVVLRRQPVRLADGRPEGGCTDAYELICCKCGMIRTWITATWRRWRPVMR